MIRRFIRFVLILMLLALIFGGVGYYIITDDLRRRTEKYNLSVTLAIETAVQSALYDATRTAENDIPHYRLITLGENEFLADVAAKYNTNPDVLRMANGLAPTVESGSGQQIIVPEGVQILTPPRRLIAITAVDGDTLQSIATHNNLSLDVIQMDNPILAQRGVLPGDIVFVAQLL